jgi:hypothetical protein
VTDPLEPLPPADLWLLGTQRSAVGRFTRKVSPGAGPLYGVKGAIATAQWALAGIAQRGSIAVLNH